MPLSLPHTYHSFSLLPAIRRYMQTITVIFTTGGINVNYLDAALSLEPTRTTETGVTETSTSVESTRASVEPTTTTARVASTSSTTETASVTSGAAESSKPQNAVMQPDDQGQGRLITFTQQGQGYSWEIGYVIARCYSCRADSMLKHIPAEIAVHTS